MVIEADIGDSKRSAVRQVLFSPRIKLDFSQAIHHLAELFNNLSSIIWLKKTRFLSEQKPQFVNSIQPKNVKYRIFKTNSAMI